MHASAWGKALGVDYVLEIHLDKMRLYQPGSLNQLYEGRGEVSVFMYDVDEGVAEPKSYTYAFSYPKTGCRDATSIPLGDVQEGVPRTPRGRTRATAHRLQASRAESRKGGNRTQRSGVRDQKSVKKRGQRPRVAGLARFADADR